MPRIEDRHKRWSEILGGRPPAGTLARWESEGYGPAEPTSETTAHYRRLAPLMGTGRDGEIAVLKMAAQRCPCRRLRDVLRGMATQSPERATADEVVEDVRGSGVFRSILDPLIPVGPQLGGESDDRPNEPAQADFLVGDAILPIAEMLAGEVTEPFDALTLSMSGDVGATNLGVTLTDLGESEEARVETDYAMLQSVVALMAKRSGWLDEASPTDLAEGVAAAEVLIDALAIQGAGISGIGDEARWRLIGSLAPTAGPLMAAVGQLVRLLEGAELDPDAKRFVSTLLGKPAPVESESTGPLDAQPKEPHP